uniref:Uncharacterized protein n=1 Tax=Globodera rostochiensis TaxID=31243 RepID=A0A914GZ70_GLORO
MLYSPYPNWSGIPNSYYSTWKAKGFPKTFFFFTDAAAAATTPRRKFVAQISARTPNYDVPSGGGRGAQIDACALKAQSVSPGGWQREKVGRDARKESTLISPSTSTEQQQQQQHLQSAWNCEIQK